MRKFLYEYESICTEADVMEEYKKNGYQYETTFRHFLNDHCLGKNGALVEILTDETPRENRQYAVTFCSVSDEDTEDTMDDTRWLTYGQRQQLIACGYRVLPIQYNS